MRRNRSILLLPVVVLLLAAGCSLFVRDGADSPDGVIHGRFVTITATAYCPCGVCCNWKLNWKGQPVIASGRSRGKPKAVGITASGTKAKPGTLAADTRSGLRPGFSTAAPPAEAERTFSALVEECRRLHAPGVETGRFGAHMTIDLTNDGPVTFLLRS